MNTEQQHYHASLRILHWAMAIGIVGLIASGWYMEGLDDAAPGKYELYDIHKSFGVLVLLAFPLRLLARLVRPAPNLPRALSAWEHRAAHVGHAALYVLMVAAPLSGYVMSTSGGHGVELFGLPLEPLVPENKGLVSASHWLHGVSAWALCTVVAVHILGVIKHRWMDAAEVDVLPRMAPGLRRHPG